MVILVASPPRTRSLRIENEKIETTKGIPIIDLSSSNDREEVSKQVVKACQEFGFFKVVNHGVPQSIISKLEKESFDFFEKPMSEKQEAGPANPYGYGRKNIGFNGDVGEVEYLLLHANPISVSQLSNSVSNHPHHFRCTVSSYIEAVRKLACELLVLVAEGLFLTDKSVFSKLITDIDSDSLLRLNHYSSSSSSTIGVGIGEHSDPQIITILRSNDVGGLQISPPQLEGQWVPVSPHPTSAFCVNVGDLLQVMTNGRLKSVRHRAMSHKNKSRMSMAFFAAPSLNALIISPPELLVAQNSASIYKPFTWSEYKKATYSLRLGDTRLHLFKAD